MIRTYIRQRKEGNATKNIFFYRDLDRAKAKLKMGESILCLVGMEFGDGFEKYRIYLQKDGSFKKKRLKFYKL